MSAMQSAAKAGNAIMYFFLSFLILNSKFMVDHFALSLVEFVEKYYVRFVDHYSPNAF